MIFLCYNLLKTMKRRVDIYMNLQRALQGENGQGFFIEEGLRVAHRVWFQR